MQPRQNICHLTHGGAAGVRTLESRRRYPCSCYRYSYPGTRNSNFVDALSAKIANN